MHRSSNVFDDDMIVMVIVILIMNIDFLTYFVCA